jgi:mevalonate kinase
LNRNTEYYSTPGKLLITGEYLILEGAQGLAVPLKYGQDMTILHSGDSKSELIWDSVHPKGTWFKGKFSIPDFNIIESNDNEFASRLINILQAAKELNQEFLTSGLYKVKTVLDFNPEYGFGSSSTLITNLARWAKADAFQLQKQTFKGSGYDVACGLEAKPILYKLKEEKPVYRPVNFNPVFSKNIFFVYLGKKQHSKDSINKFYSASSFTRKDIDSINEITKGIVKTDSLDSFEELLKEHEKIMSAVLKTATIQKQYFSFYNQGIVKSLGAWGGDFVLITSGENPEVFKKEMNMRGFPVVYTYDELLL